MTVCGVLFFCHFEYDLSCSVVGCLFWFVLVFSLSFDCLENRCSS